MDIYSRAMMLMASGLLVVYTITSSQELFNLSLWAAVAAIYMDD